LGLRRFEAQRQKPLESWQIDFGLAGDLKNYWYWRIVVVPAMVALQDHILIFMVLYGGPQTSGS
jgi:hypothetical protein